MKFRSVLASYNIVIKPARWEVIDGIRMLRPGLRARFNGGEFDSLVAQRALGYTDEERLLIEKRLLEHNEFGQPGGIWLADGEQYPPGYVNPAVRQYQGEGCIFAVMTAEGSVVCRKVIISEDVPYCWEHAAAILRPDVLEKIRSDMEASGKLLPAAQPEGGSAPEPPNEEDYAPTYLCEKCGTAVMEMDREKHEKLEAIAEMGRTQGFITDEDDPATASAGSAFFAGGEATG